MFVREETNTLEPFFMVGQTCVTVRQAFGEAITS